MRHFASAAAFLWAAHVVLAGNPYSLGSEPEQGTQRSDAFGDPLPNGCVAKIGSSRLRHSRGTRDVAFAANDRLLLSLGGDGVLVAWEVATGRRLWSSSPKTGITSFAIAPDANLLVTYEPRRGIGAYSLDDKQLTERAFVATEKRFGDVVVAISKDGQYCAASGLAGETVVWRIGPENKLEKVLTAPIVAAMGTRICFSGDGRWLACSPSRRGGMVVIDVASAKFITDLTSDAIGEVTDFDYLSSSQSILVARQQGAEHGVALLSDIERQGKVTPLFSEKELPWVRAAVDGKTLWTVVRHEDLVKRTVERGEIVSRVRVQDKMYEILARGTLSADGSKIAFATNPVRLFDLSSGRQLLVEETAGPNGWSGIPLVDRDERHLVLADSVWDLRNGKLIRRATDGWLLAAPQPDVFSLSANDRTLSIRWSRNEVPLAVRPLHTTRLARPRPLTVSRHIPVVTFQDGPKRKLSLELIDTEAGIVREIWHLDDFSGVPVPNAAVQTATSSLGMVAILDDQDRVHLVASGDEPRYRVLAWNEAPVRRRKLVLSLSDDGTRLAGFDVANGKLTIWDTTSLQQIALIRVATAAEILERAGRAKEGRVATLGLSTWCEFSNDNELVYVFSSESFATEPHPGSPLLVSAYDVARGESVHRDRVITSSAGLVDFLCCWESFPLVRPSNVRFVTGTDLRFDTGDGTNMLPRTIAVSADGGMCAYQTRDNEIAVIETASGQRVARLAPATERVRSLGFTSSGRLLVVQTSDYLYSAWDVHPWPIAQADRQEPLENIWENLASPEAALAHRAAWLLAERQDEAVTLLASKLAPAAGKSVNERVERLIGDLTAPGILRRENAWKELGSLGGEYHARIARQSRKCGDPSTRRALGNLLTKLSPEIKDGQTLRQLRALSALARIDSEKSRALLAKVANGDPDDPVTARARLSLMRQSCSIR